MHVTDLFATALDLAGVVPRIDEDLRGLPSDGVSFLPVLLGESDSERRVVYTEGLEALERAEIGMPASRLSLQADRLDGWRQYLFDLKEDPREEQNLLEEPGELSIDEADAYAALQASYLELRTP